MMFRREVDTDAIRAKARKRMDRQSEIDVLNWCEQAGSGVAKALDDYRRERSAFSLQEAQEGISALQGCLDSIRNRIT